jgi:hypothetical protein
MDTQLPHPLEQEQSLKRPFKSEGLDTCPSNPILPVSSALTNAEEVVGNGTEEEYTQVADPQSPSKKRKVKLEPEQTPNADARDKVKGIALVKAE